MREVIWLINRFEKFSLSISEIFRYWHRLAADELKKYGLKGPHVIYFTTLYRYENGVTGPRLCELCGKDKSDVSRMISIMEEKGLVKKESEGKSLYRGKIKLTDEGKEVAEHINKRAALAVELAGKGLSEEDRAVFYSALETITNNLKKISEKGLPAQ